MIQKKRKFSKQKKKIIITEWAHAFKAYASSYNAEILNSFNPDLQLRDTKSAIKNKLQKIIDWIKKIWIRDNTNFSI